VHLITVSIEEIRPMELSLSTAVAAALPAVRDAVRAALADQRALMAAPPVALAVRQPWEPAGHA
jgi:hypothetical protein